MKNKSVAWSICKLIICIIGYIFSFIMMIMPTSNPMTLILYIVLAFAFMIYGGLFGADVAGHFYRKKIKMQIDNILTYEYKEVQVLAYIYSKIPSFFKYALRGNKVNFYAKRSYFDENTILLNFSYNGVFDENKFTPIEMTYIDFSNSFILE